MSDRIGEHEIKRKLATIMVADIVGFSRLTANDEDWTIRSLGEFRRIVDDIIERHDGRIFNTGGDSVLAEFGSPVEAVRCAVDFQEAARSRNLLQPRDKQLRFRIGLNLGDVMVRGTDLLGDGVNVAARLEGLAEAGGICVSGTVWDQVNGKLSIGYIDIGEQSVKNIPRPVRAYHLRVDGGIEEVQKSAAALPDAEPVRLRADRGSARLGPVLAGGAVLAIVVGGLAWHFWPNAVPPGPPTAAPPRPAPSAAPAPTTPASTPTRTTAPTPAATPTAPASPPAATGVEGPLKEMLSARFALLVPRISEKAREEGAAEYANAPGHKAQAALSSPPGIFRSTSRPSLAEAENAALEGCQIFHGQPCALLAVNQTVLPAPADNIWPTRDMPRVRYSGEFDPAQIPAVLDNRRHGFEVASYREETAPKAIAFHPWGRIFVKTKAVNQRAAEEEALRLCNDDPDRKGRTGPCFLYSVGNRVVLPLRLRDPLTPAS